MKPKRLAFAPLRAFAFTTLYTVPEGTTTLLKNITATYAYEATEFPATLVYLVPAGVEFNEADPGGYLLLQLNLMNIGELFDWEGQHVLHPGDRIIASGAASNVLLSGVELDMSW